MLVLDNLATLAGRILELYNGGYEREVLVGGMKYQLNLSFTTYEYLNISVKPTYLILRRFKASSILNCFFQYEATIPVTIFG